MSEFDRLKAQKDAILNREREVMKAVLDDAAAKRIAFLEAKVAELEADLDVANKTASDTKFQNERLVREIGYAAESLWSGESMSSQLKGMEVAMRDLTSTLFKVEKERDELKATRDGLEDLLRRSIQLPRPWMDGGITWEKWSTLFSDIERAIDRPKP